MRSTRLRFRRPILGLAMLLGLGAALWLGCRGNSPQLPLGPTGGLDDSCISELQLIQMVGDFTEPAWSIPDSPALQLGPGCVWSVVVRFNTAGDHLFKFVTEGAFDNPQDFGWNEAQALRVGADNPVLRVSGTGTGIKLTIPVAGCYLIRLFETELIFRADPTSCSTGGIRGVVAFENATQPPLPRARVQARQQGIESGADSSSADDGTFEIIGLAAGTYDVRYRAFGYLDTTVTGVAVEESVVEIAPVTLRAGCISAFDSIQVVGQFTTPPFDLSVSPVMQQVEGCIWEAEVSVAAGTHLFKLVTNGQFDTPPDYGGDEAVTLPIDSTFAVQSATGQGTAIRVDFPITAIYSFRLDEAASTLRVSLGAAPADLSGILVYESVPRAPLPVSVVTLLQAGAPTHTGTSRATDGTFLLAGIPAGRYDVLVEPPLAAPTHLDTTLANVGASLATNLGQIFLARAPGSLQGIAAFSDIAAAPFPVATAEVRRGTTVAASVRTTATDPSYRVPGLKPGTYSVRLAATGYIDSTFTVTVARGVTNTGTVALDRLVCAAYPTVQALQLGGREIDNSPNDLTFTWNLGNAPVMAQVARCRWETSVTCAFVADYRIKFILNGDFGGDPPDFGGDNTTVYPPDSTVAVVPVATPGIGDAIRIRIENPGVYRFGVDLGTLRFSYTRIGDLPEGVRRETVAQALRRRLRALR